MRVRLPSCRTSSGKPDASRDRARRGFTLLELLIVLGVLVTIAALSWPRMMRYMEENSLKQDVELVRRELAGTRILAIESGLTYQFRFEPTGETFVILPFDRPEIISTEGGAAPEPKDPPKVKTLVGHLSTGARFESSTDKTGGSTGAQRLDKIWLELLKNGALYDETLWSPPILFRPHGESQDAQLVIRDKIGNTIELTVRGLTGSVRVGDLRRPEKQP